MMPPYVELNLFTWQFLLVAPISLGVIQGYFYSIYNGCFPFNCQCHPSSLNRLFIKLLVVSIDLCKCNWYRSSPIKKMEQHHTLRKVEYTLLGLNVTILALNLTLQSWKIFQIATCSTKDAEPRLRVLCTAPRH